MKTKFSKLVVAILAFGLTYACSEKEDLGTLSNEATAEAQFTFNLDDQFGDTRTGNEDIIAGQPGSCKTMDQLNTLATGQNLFAKITLTKGASTYDTGELVIRAITKNGKTYLQADSYPLNIDKDVNGNLIPTTYTVTKAIIYTKEVSGNTTNELLLFSGVGTSSKYASYIDATELMGNKKIELTSDHRFKKTSFDLYVLCAENQPAADFGFIKWDINYVKSHCFPIMVNICDNDEGDIQAEGYVKVEYRIPSYGEDETGYEKWVVLHSENPSDPTHRPFKKGEPGSICFKDDFNEEDANETHRITLVVYKKQTTQTGAKTILFSKSILLTTAQLKLYDQYEDWNGQLNFMHINFCTCDTWEFPNDCDDEVACSENGLSFLQLGVSKDKCVFLSENGDPIKFMNEMWNTDSKGSTPIPNKAKFKSLDGINYKSLKGASNYIIHIVHRHKKLEEPVAMLSSRSNEEVLLFVVKLLDEDGQVVGYKEVAYRDADNKNYTLTENISFDELVTPPSSAPATRCVIQEDGCYYVQIEKKCTDRTDFHLHFDSFYITQP